MSTKVTLFSGAGYHIYRDYADDGYTPHLKIKGDEIALPAELAMLILRLYDLHECFKGMISASSKLDKNDGGLFAINLDDPARSGEIIDGKLPRDDTDVD